MKRAALFLILAASTARADSAYRIARDADAPGRFIRGDCKQFAVEVERKLRAVGCDSRLVFYRWRHDWQQGFHAVVVFRSGDRWYLIDNMMWRPVWIKGPDDIKTVKPNFVSIIEPAEEAAGE